MPSTRPEIAQGGFPEEAGRLRVGPPSPYVYRSAYKRAAAKALDSAGRLAFRRHRPEVDWSEVRKVAVLRLDHLGDLLHQLPFLRRLRSGLPGARIELWTGPWGRELAGMFADVDQVRETPASWFARPARVEWPWGDIRALARGLKEGGYDAAFEPRGDLRHHLALWGSGIQRRIGHAVTAGGFLLTQEVPWDPGLHEQDQSLALATACGLPEGPPPAGGYLEIPASALEQAEALARALKLGARRVLVQAACGTAAKRWPPEAWARVIDGLPRGVDVCLLGSASERAEMEALAARCHRAPAVAAGRLDLGGLTAFVGRAEALLSVDSGPAHLAAVQGVKVLCLFSGTNRAGQWAPRGAGVRILRGATTPCSPCELSECPFGNACMASLEPATVLEGALGLLAEA